jgi:alkaline phosphatase isozyme conversion protein
VKVSLYNNRNIVIIASLVLTIGCAARELPFDVDGSRAFEHVVFLADSIGPRVTGSVEDGITRDYIAEKMAATGLEVQRQRVSSVWLERTFGVSEQEFTFDSENIIGIRRGRTRRTILVSGHFDSWGRSSPGANDNASSIGVLLEIARAIQRYEWNSTIMFAAFCAEERGLLGSRYFVDNTDLRDLVLAINMDPVGHDRLLISPMPDSPPLAYQKKFMQLSRTYGIPRAAVDPMHIIIPRYLSIGFGADHMPFLDAGYTAFSVNNMLSGWNYHSTHDRSEYVEPETLEAAAMMIIAFLLEYDDNKEPPAHDSPVYIAQPIMGNFYVFITTPYLLILLSLSLIALLYFGITERQVIKQINPFGFIIIFLKILLLAVIQVLFIFLPIFGGMIHERTLYPWMANPALYMVMGIASGMVGLFFIIQLVKLTKLEPGVRQLKYWAILTLLIYTILAVVFLGIDVAYYFAAPLLLFLVSLRISGTVWLLLIGAVGIFPLFGSVGPMQVSMMITLLGITIPVFTLMVTVFFLSLPFIFYFAAILQGEDNLAGNVRKVLSHTATPAIAMLCFIGLFFHTSSMTVYHEDNPQLINQTAWYDLNTDAGTMFLASYDFLPVMQDEISGQLIEPDDIMVHYPLEIDPGLTDLFIESELSGDTVSLYFSMSEPSYRDFITIRIRSDNEFDVLSSVYDKRREDRTDYLLNILSAEGAFGDTVVIRREAAVTVQYTVHTFDVSEQPRLSGLIHPLAFRYYQRMQAVIEID